MLKIMLAYKKKDVLKLHITWPQLVCKWHWVHQLVLHHLKALKHRYQLEAGSAGIS